MQTASDTRTNTLIVYAAPRDMEEVRRLVKELDVPKSGAVNRAQIIRVHDALATDVAQTLEQAIAAAQTGQSGRSAVLELLAVDDQGQEILRSGMLSEVSITPNPRNNTLIVTAPPGAMELIQAFIEQLDTPGDRAQIKVFRVVNGDATNLVSMLRSLIPFASRSDARAATPLGSGGGVFGAAAVLRGSPQQQYYRRRLRGRFADCRGAAQSAGSKRIHEPPERGLSAEERAGHRCRNFD